MAMDHADQARPYGENRMNPGMERRIFVQAAGLAALAAAVEPGEDGDRG
jgi:hypothetical protein